MTEAATGVASPAIEQLVERVAELEKRVAALESTPAKPAAEPIVLNARIERPRPPETWKGFPPVAAPSGIVPTLGRAVVGIAGAYLFRAIAESGSVPQTPVLVAAIAYAFLWMHWAVKNRSNAFTSGTYALTSVLILSPLLWESTVRFQFLSPTFAAVALLAYFGFALAVAWRHELGGVLWIATLATASTAVALLIATHDLVPFCAALVGMTLVAEYSTVRGRFTEVRAVPGFAADFSVALLVYVMTSATIPDTYTPAHSATVITVWLTLFLIAIAGICIRVFRSKETIGTFDVVQGAFVFLVALYGALRAPQAFIAPVFGILLLALAAGCYWGALVRFSDSESSWNRRVVAFWAASLFLAGVLFVFPAALAILCLCAGAAAATFMYGRTGKVTLGVQASFFLLAASIVSPLGGFMLSALTGTVPAAPGWTAWLVTATAAGCYLIGGRIGKSDGRLRLLWVVPAAITGIAVSALAVLGTATLATGHWDFSASRVSVIRTVVNCIMALGFAYFGIRLNRAELKWIAYAAVLFGTAKLLFEDLRFGNPASLVLSLLFYGLILILLPRMAKRSSSELAGANLD